jgi:hypothetical protein
MFASLTGWYTQPARHERGCGICGDELAAVVGDVYPADAVESV